MQDRTTSPLHFEVWKSDCNFPAAGGEDNASAGTQAQCLAIPPGGPATIAQVESGLSPIRFDDWAQSWWDDDLELRGYVLWKKPHVTLAGKGLIDEVFIERKP